MVASYWALFSREPSSSFQPLSTMTKWLLGLGSIQKDKSAQELATIIRS